MYRWILFSAVVLLAAQLSAQPSIGQPVDGLGLTDGSNPVAAGNVAQGTSGHVCVQFALTNIVNAGGSPVDFVGLTLNSLGTVTPLTDYTGAALYKDSNGNGQVDAGETQLSTWTAMTTVATPWFGSFSDTPPLYPATTDYLVTLDIAPGATTGAYAEISISAPEVSSSGGKTLALATVLGAQQTITGSQQQPLAIDSPAAGALPDAVEGTPYSVTIAASGGVPSYAWSILSGSLPPGLSLDPSTGEIAGTATGAGYFSFTVQVADGVSATAMRDYTVTVIDPAQGGTPPAPGGGSGGGGGCSGTTGGGMLWPLLMMLMALGYAGRRRFSSR